MKDGRKAGGDGDGEDGGRRGNRRPKIRRQSTGGGVDGTRAEAGMSMVMRGVKDRLG